MFVKPEVRKSLLAKMLSELLDTRVMVKNGMKSAAGNKALLKMLNARQMALKFLANVTYGYCGATFSGRMPCVEIADAIVQTGRETLEKVSSTFSPFLTRFLILFFSSSVFLRLSKSLILLQNGELKLFMEIQILFSFIYLGKVRRTPFESVTTWQKLLLLSILDLSNSNSKRFVFAYLFLSGSFHVY